MGEFDRRDRLEPVPMQVVRGENPLPRDVSKEARLRGDEMARRNLQGASAEILKAHDFYNRINDEEDIAETTHLACNELSRRMRLPDDDEDSLVDADTGQVSMKKLDEFMKPIQERLDTAGKSVIDPFEKMAVREMAAKARTQIGVFMAGEAVNVQQEKLEVAFQRRLDGCMDRDDFGGAIAVVDDAERRGIFSPMEAYKRRRMLTKAQTVKVGTTQRAPALGIPAEQIKTTERKHANLSDLL